MKRGGAANMMIQMANSLCGEVRKVIVCSRGGELDVLLDKNILQVPINFRIEKNLFAKIFYYLTGGYKLYKIIRKHEISVIINHHRYFAPIFFCISKVRTVTIIYNAHSSPEGYSIVNGRILGDHIIAVSNSVKKHMVENFNISPEKIEVIYNGIPPLQEYGKEKIESLKSELKVKDAIVASCIGHFTNLKGQDFLIRAWADLISSGNDVKLILLGFGETELELRKLVKDLKLENYVTILVNSYLPEEIINISDFIILPSRREGLGIVLLEAFSLGKPAIGTNTSGIREVIEDSVNGYLFEYHNVMDLISKIQNLIKSKVALTAFGKNAFNTYQEKFTSEMYKDSLLKYLNAIRIIT